MWEEYSGDLALIQDKTISIVSTLQNYYFNTEWGVSVGNIQIVLSAIIYIESFGDLEAPAC